MVTLTAFSLAAMAGLLLLEALEYMALRRARRTRHQWEPVPENGFVDLRGLTPAQVRCYLRENQGVR